MDRESVDKIEVVITIQDEAFNLIPFRREIVGKTSLIKSLFVKKYFLAKLSKFGKNI